MSNSSPWSAPASRFRRLLAAALCLLLVYALALNLLWEMWSETGSFGLAMDLSMWLFGVPGRLGVYMLLPWLHVIAAIVLCIGLYGGVVYAGQRGAARAPEAPAASTDGGYFFLMWGGLTIAVAFSFAGLYYRGEAAIEAASHGQVPQRIAIGDLPDARALDAPKALLAAPAPGGTIRALPLGRRSSGEQTLYVPLVPAAGPGPEVRALLHVKKPLRVEVVPADSAPPYVVRRLFAPVPTWVRGELRRTGLRVASDAVLVERVGLDAEGRVVPVGLSARLEALAMAGVGGFCGLLLMGLHVLMRR